MRRRYRRRAGPIAALRRHVERQIALAGALHLTTAVVALGAAKGGGPPGV